MPSDIIQKGKRRDGDIVLPISPKKNSTQRHEGTKTQRKALLITLFFVSLSAFVLN